MIFYPAPIKATPTALRWNAKIQFIFDESDNISNPSSKQTLSVLSCFRRCKYKLLTTGTSTRNNKRSIGGT